MNKKTIVISAIWLGSMLLLFAVVVSTLKFPTFNNERYGNIIIPLTIIVPLIALVYSIIAYKNQKNSKVIDSFIVLGLIIGILYSFVCTFGFKLPYTLFYPLASTTTDKENYLIIEDALAEDGYELECIHRVFPNQIPKNATDVEYYYRCDWLSNYRIEVKWRLPYEEYRADKEQTMASLGESLTLENGNSSFNFHFDMYGYTAKKEFDDNKSLISYEFVCNTFLN